MYRQASRQVPVQRQRQYFGPPRLSQDGEDLTGYYGPFGEPPAAPAAAPSDVGAYTPEDVAAYYASMAPAAVAPPADLAAATAAYTPADVAAYYTTPPPEPGPTEEEIQADVLALQTAMRAPEPLSVEQYLAPAPARPPLVVGTAATEGPSVGQRIWAGIKGIVPLGIGAAVTAIAPPVTAAGGMVAGGSMLKVVTDAFGNLRYAFAPGGTPSTSRGFTLDTPSLRPADVKSFLAVDTGGDPFGFGDLRAPSLYEPQPIVQASVDSPDLSLPDLSVRTPPLARPPSAPSRILAATTPERVRAAVHFGEPFPSYAPSIAPAPAAARPPTTLYAREPSYAPPAYGPSYEDYAVPPVSRYTPVAPSYAPPVTPAMPMARPFSYAQPAPSAFVPAPAPAPIFLPAPMPSGLVAPGPERAAAPSPVDVGGAVPSMARPTGAPRGTVLGATAPRGPDTTVWWLLIGAAAIGVVATQGRTSVRRRLRTRTRPVPRLRGRR